VLKVIAAIKSLISIY